MFRQRLSYLVIALIVVGCGKSLPEFQNLDLKAWRGDKHACADYRAKNIESIRTQKEKLLALNESQIIELLGRPDRNELYKRNQKFFFYDLEAGHSCDSLLMEWSQLSIRFNAMGLAKEVAIE
jgi:hypothetical protein